MYMGTLSKSPSRARAHSCSDVSLLLDKSVIENNDISIKDYPNPKKRQMIQKTINSYYNVDTLWQKRNNSLYTVNNNHNNQGNYSSEHGYNQTPLVCIHIHNSSDPQNPHNQHNPHKPPDPYDICGCVCVAQHAVPVYVHPINKHCSSYVPNNKKQCHVHRSDDLIIDDSVYLIQAQAQAHAQLPDSHSNNTNNSTSSTITTNIILGTVGIFASFGLYYVCSFVF